MIFKETTRFCGISLKMRGLKIKKNFSLGESNLRIIEHSASQISDKRDTMIKNFIWIELWKILLWFLLC